MPSALAATARVLALLELLQGGGTHTVAELAERLAVDERTARRYVHHLRDLDIPVEAVRGRYGGYRLARHFRLPPLMLTDEEALAVVWALLVNSGTATGPASGHAARSAYTKVRRVLPPPLTRRIDAVLDTVSFTTVPTDVEGEPHGSTRGLMALAEAAREHHPVTFRYTGGQNRPAQRRVQPQGVVAHRGRLYLIGFDLDREAVRTFRLDRIARVGRLAGSFAPPAAVDPVREVIGPLAAAPSMHEVALRIRADLDHVRSRLPDTVASVTAGESDDDANDGWLRVFLRAERLSWVAGTLAMLDRPFVIEHPAALNDTVAALGHRPVAVARTTTAEDAATPWDG